MNIRLGLVSAYSFLYGVHKPETLLEKAASFGVKTISICDINNLYGLHSFIEAAKEKNIRPIIGVTLTQEPKPHSSLNTSHSTLNTPHSTLNTIYCFVANRSGFGRLNEILSIRNKDTKNFDPIPLLRENSYGLVLASANRYLLSELAGSVEHLYRAITPDDLSVLGSNKELNLPLAFLDTSLFLEKDDYPVHKVLRAIGLNKTIGNLSLSDTVANGKGLFKSGAELAGLVNSWPEAVKGTEHIAEICRFNEIFDGFIFPSYGENPVSELRHRVFNGAVLRYGELGDMEIDRIEYELDIIEKMGFAPYFLRIDDIVKMANSKRTCGRGSGAASIVSYSLGITNVDPIAHDLYFERFLSPARPDPPDIDIDFAWDERDELINSVFEKFGPEYCARVANHNFFRTRSALRETAKAYGFSDAAITKLEKKLLVTSDKCLVTSDDCGMGSGGDNLWREIFFIAGKIEGLPRGLSMHCGGIVITAEAINRYAPIEKSLEGYPLLAWEKEGTEAAGFVKIDLLGNRSLAVIRDAVENVCLMTNEECLITNVEWGMTNVKVDSGNEIYLIRKEELRGRLDRAIGDRETIGALARGDSIGVFYIESPAMRQLQKKSGVGDFEHIVIHSSIIRPAANKFISEYVRRLKGGAWKPLHPRLDKILNESYGILCYQEDVSKTAVALAGFDEAGADKLRKVIAKKAGAEKLKVYEKQFFEGCRKNKVDEKTINDIWAMMLSFDGYSFCKPHSASYAMVSFQSAYLRVHYPAEFMAAVLSNQGGYYRPHAYISEIRRMGLLTEGPDINLSKWKYWGMTNVVVIGLMAVKGVSVTGINRILDERERGGRFLSLEDFSRRVKLSRDDITSLCPAGVFDSISSGLSRPHQARFLLVTSDKCVVCSEELLVTSDKLGIKNGELSNSSLHTSNSTLVTKQQEYEALGFLRGGHPLVLWKEAVLGVKDRVKAIDIHKYINRRIRIIGWPVTQKEVWTKDGLNMSFYSFEDETAMYETVIFPEIYDRYNRFLFDQHPLIVSGIVKDDQGAVILEVTRIEII
ncbi:MAG: DNA polymerase III subunit alpha [Treponema sp.]|nr:DNA polymerase III subunit alpha [Treponema sp.]